MDGGREKREKGKGRSTSKGQEGGEEVLRAGKVRRKELPELRETDLMSTVE